MLKAGDAAPRFRLGAFSLEDLAAPVLLAFFKVNCPTCQLTFPFLQRIADRGGLNVVGISQNDPDLTAEFNVAFGIRFSTIEDPEAEGYQVSNAYRIDHVPSLFLVEPDGRISAALNGFVKEELERLAERFAAAPLFTAADRVPAYKPG